MKKKKHIGLVVQLLGSMLVLGSVIMIYQKKLLLLEEKRDKFKKYYNCLNTWLKNIHFNRTSCDFFQKNQYQRVAIYGFGEIGKRLYEEISKSDIQISYVIDQYEDYEYHLDTYLIDDSLPEVDVIVVTPLFDFESIKEELKQKVNCPIISIEQVIAE